MRRKFLANLNEFYIQCKHELLFITLQTYPILHCLLLRKNLQWESGPGCDLGFTRTALINIFCGNGSDYAKHGVAMGCDCCGDNVGANRFCAWEAGASAPGCDGSGSDHSAYLGCYANRNNDRTLPVQVPGKGHTVMECEQACEEMGMSRFAREWKGQCFCGNESHDYTKHGEETGCDCCGDNVGGNKMCVYVNGNMNR